MFARAWKLLVVDQWQALRRDHPVDPSPSGGDAARILGLYAVGAFVLSCNFFYAMEFGRFVAENTADEWPGIVRRCTWAWTIALCYVVPGSLYAYFALGLTPRDLGLRIGGLVDHVPLYLAFLGVVAPFVVLVSTTASFQESYPIAKMAGRNYLFMGLWMISYAVQFVGVEFFFRGFLLHGGVRVMGPWVLPAMLIPYVMLHFQKPPLEAAGSLIAGLALGVVSLRTGSVVAGIAIHVAVAWSMDWLSLWQKGELPIPQMWPG